MHWYSAKKKEDLVKTEEDETLWGFKNVSTSVWSRVPKVLCNMLLMIPAHYCCIAALWSKGWTKFKFSFNIFEHQIKLCIFAILICHLIEERRHLNATICFKAVYVCDELCCTYSTAEGTSAFQKCHFCGTNHKLAGQNYFWNKILIISIIAPKWIYSDNFEFETSCCLCKYKVKPLT